MAEGRREWTICGTGFTDVPMEVDGPRLLEGEEVRVAEVGVSPEEELGTSADYERGVEDGLAWARGGPEPPCGAEADRPEQVGLSREEIEALAWAAAYANLNYLGAAPSEQVLKDSRVLESARAKLRAYLGGTDG